MPSRCPRARWATTLRWPTPHRTRPAVAGRSSDDRYIVYTGGTTGMPKGVVWRHEDIFKASMGGGDIAQLGNYVTSREELAQRLPEVGLIALAVPPLMHSSAHWLVFHQLYTGGLTVLVPHGRFDAAADLGAGHARAGLQPHRSSATPWRARCWTSSRPTADRYDTSLLWVIASGGAILSAVNKERLLRAAPRAADRRRLRVVGDRRARAASRARAERRSSSTNRPRCSTTTARRWRRAAASSGRLARRGHIPLRYHKDPEKTARTFLELDGVRWVLPGDMATVEEDGTHHAAGPRQRVDQHRRREGLPRGGRGGAQGAPGGPRRRRGRGPRRPLGRARHRGRPGRSRAAPRTWPALQEHCRVRTSRATRSPGRSCWSTRSRARRPASPTTAGPRTRPSPRRRSLRRMQRLSGMDSSHLSMETATSPMHVVGVLLLDLAGTPGDDASKFEVVRQMLADRIHLMPAFRRRLVAVPFDLDHPRWIDDPDFDLEQHVRRVAVPAPGDLRALGQLVGDIASQRLDRGRPLWELWVVEGLEGDQVAVITKIHHAAIDGASGADLMVNLFDLTPEVRVVEPPTAPFTGETPPSDLQLLGTALVRLGFVPFRVAAQLGRSAGNFVGTARQTLSRRNGDGATLPFSAPRTPFSGALTPHRSVAFARVALERPQGHQERLRRQGQRRAPRADVARAARLAARPRRPAGQAAGGVVPDLGAQGGRRGRHEPDLGDARPAAGAARGPRRRAPRDHRLDARSPRTSPTRWAPRRCRTGRSTSRRGCSTPRCSSTRRCASATCTARCRTSSSPTSPARRCRCTAPARASRRSSRWDRCCRAPGSTSRCCRTWATSTSGIMACRETVPDVWDIAEAFPAAVAALKAAADLDLHCRYGCAGT